MDAEIIIHNFSSGQYIMYGHKMNNMESQKTMSPLRKSCRMILKIKEEKKGKSHSNRKMAKTFINLFDKTKFLEKTKA